MTKYIQIICSALLLAFSISSCDPSSPSGSSSSTPAPASGLWKVTYFFDKTDETSNYTAYTFDFKSNGSIEAKNGSQSWNGTWSNQCDDSSDKICISFSGSIPSTLEELSEDWRVIELKDNFMHFEHVSGGNGDTDVVHFEK